MCPHAKGGTHLGALHKTLRFESQQCAIVAHFVAQIVAQE